MNGFELLSRLTRQPFVIFTTAYRSVRAAGLRGQLHRLPAQAHRTEQLERALKKLDRLRPIVTPEWQQKPRPARPAAANSPHRCAKRARAIRTASPRASASASLSSTSTTSPTSWPTTSSPTPSSTAAATASIRPSPNSNAVSIPRDSCASTASALVNVDWIHEVNSWFAGKVILTLKDAQHTQLTVARDRVRSVKDRLGI